MIVLLDLVFRSIQERLIQVMMKVIKVTMIMMMRIFLKLSLKYRD